MEQLELLKKVTRVLEEVGVPHAVCGSIASGAYGEPRMTRDIDIVADVHSHHIPLLRKAFPSPQYYLSAEAASEALVRRTQFNIIHGASGNKVDVMIPHMDDWDHEQMARRRRLPLFADQECYVAAPEDVIIAKLRYYREGGSEKHLRDITGILRVSSELVDREYVDRWAATLGLSEIWQAVLRRLG